MGTHPIFESDFDCLTVQIGMSSLQSQYTAIYEGLEKCFQQDHSLPNNLAELREQQEKSLAPVKAEILKDFEKKRSCALGPQPKGRNEGRVKLTLPKTTVLIYFAQFCFFLFS